MCSPVDVSGLHAQIRRSSRCKLTSGLAAMQMEGVVGYFDHTTVPGHNDIGPVIHDEEIFASEKVTCIGGTCQCKPLSAHICYA